MQALMRAGFYFKRQEGSHITLRRDKPFTQVVVPEHKELDRGTLRAIIRQAGLSIEEFIGLLR
jgi:predicted RNA binding protein YcfA (HicA-like mRNA interferase family)